MPVTIYSIILLCVVLVFTGCQSVPIAYDIALEAETDEKYSSKVEEKLGNAGYYFVMLNYKVVDDMKLYHRLIKLGARITRYCDRPNLKYKYIIIDSKYRNAISLPDGYIIFTKSFLEALNTDENIQAVIAHEVAHISHKHSVILYEKKKGRNFLRNIFGEDVWSIAVNMGYHQAFEFQADQTACRYLYRSGIDPEILIDVLKLTKRIQEEDKKEFEKSLKDKEAKKMRKLNKKLIMTHPDIGNRIVNYRNYISTVKETEKIKYNPEDFIH